MVQVNVRAKDINLSKAETIFIGLLTKKNGQKLIFKNGSDRFFHNDLTLFSKYFSKNEIKRLLENLSNKKILKKEIEKSYLICPNCGENKSAILLKCPICDSIKIGVIENIRHIKCGYMGQKEEFYNGLNFRCPSCNEKINGSNYITNNSHFICRNCGTQVNKDNFEILCLKCKHKYPITDALEETIISYELSTD